MLPWVFAVVGAVLVFAIAAAFVGSEAFRLGHTPTTAIFDLDEAVDHVAQGLSDEAAAGLTMDEVRQLILFSLDHLRAKGLTAMPGEELAFADGPPVVVADDDGLGAVDLGGGEQGEHRGVVDHAGLVNDQHGVSVEVVVAVLESPQQRRCGAGLEVGRGAEGLGGLPDVAVPITRWPAVS